MVINRLNIKYQDARFYVSGIIDEQSNFSDIIESGDNPIYIDLSGLERITSFGVKGWIIMLNSLAGKDVIYVNCPVVFIEQVNLVPGFKGLGKIESFDVPFFCSFCDKEHTYLTTALTLKEEKFLNVINAQYNCPNCNKELEFDSTKHYFHFFGYPSYSSSQGIGRGHGGTLADRSETLVDWRNR